MIRQDELAYLIDAQKNFFPKSETGFTRDVLITLPKIDSFATIVTGIRRYGKSTLNLQMLQGHYQDVILPEF
jgi:predicted AAA+ superfamily ATPase